MLFTRTFFTFITIFYQIYHYYIKQNNIENDNDELMLITNIMSFIILNQVFGDGNHRTAYYALITFVNNDLQHLFTDEKYNFNELLFDNINMLFDNVDYINETKLPHGSIYTFSNFKEDDDGITFFDNVSKLLSTLINMLVIDNVDI